RITDSQGRRIDFKNAIVIMTSNIGSTYLLEAQREDDSLDENTKDLVLGQLRASFRPEFLNRVDDIIIFKPLTLENIKGIVTKLAKELQHRLSEQNLKIGRASCRKRIKISVSDKVIKG